MKTMTTTGVSIIADRPRPSLIKAKPPPGLEPGSPFGPNLRAFALYLRFTQAIGFERLSQLFSDLLGVEISEGALVNILADSRDAFARQASLIRAKLLASTILQSDETSVRVGKQTWWLWVFHHADSAYFVIHRNRRLRQGLSRAVVEAENSFQPARAGLPALRQCRPAGRRSRAPRYGDSLHAPRPA